MTLNRECNETDQPKLEKAALRRRFLELRALVGGADRQKLDTLIRNRVLEVLTTLQTSIATPAETVGSFASRPSPVVGMYRAFRGEVDVFPLLDELMSQGWQVACPITHRDEGTLSFHLVGPRSLWKTGAYGITEPDLSNAEVPPERLQVLLIPGVAFSRDGWRLGYGGGYYDRLFDNPGMRAIRIGIAYDVQLVNELPHEAHDARMDWIVTPREVQSCRHAPLS